MQFGEALGYPRFRCARALSPVSSEFVEGGEIRHHWECEACGEPSSTAIPVLETADA
jgi:hypothetical protein